jgi:hypothetical protein
VSDRKKCEVSRNNRFNSLFETVLVSFELYGCFEASEHLTSSVTAAPRCRHCSTIQTFGKLLRSGRTADKDLSPAHHLLPRAYYNFRISRTHLRFSLLVL